MNHDIDTAIRYRQHAEQLRLIAAGYPVRDAIIMLTCLAQDYERMAQVYDGSEIKNIEFLRTRHPH